MTRSVWWRFWVQFAQKWKGNAPIFRPPAGPPAGPPHQPIYRENIDISASSTSDKYNIGCFYRYATLPIGINLRFFFFSVPTLNVLLLPDLNSISSLTTMILLLDDLWSIILLFHPLQPVPSLKHCIPLQGDLVYEALGAWYIHQYQCIYQYIYQYIIYTRSTKYTKCVC